MKKKKSFLFKIIFVIISCGIFLSCQENKNSKNDVTEPLARKPQSPIPTPESEEEEKEIYRWYYKGSIDNFSSSDEIKECPTEFLVDGICNSALSLCKKKITVYACYPENLEIRVTGKVLDENNQPIENVKIYGSLGFADYSNIGESYSKKTGKFILKVENYCVRIVVALKDGYVSLLGRPNGMALTRCKTENFAGAKDITIHLKKVPRTPNTIEAKSEERFCRVVGKVLNSDGSGLPGVKVANGKQSTLSDQDGNYIIEKQEKCDNYCTLWKENYRSIFPVKNNRAVVSCFLGQPNDVVFESK